MGMRASLMVVSLALAGLVAGPRTGVARAEPPADCRTNDAGVDADLFARSKGFRELLEAVRARGEQLDRRERELVAREAAMRAREAMAVERTAGQGATVLGTAAAAPCSVALVRIYQAMRPRDVASIVDRLDDATAREILGCMGEKHVGAILAAMNRERAVAVTKALAGRF